MKIIKIKPRESRWGSHREVNSEVTTGMAMRSNLCNALLQHAVRVRCVLGMKAVADGLEESF